MASTEQIGALGHPEKHAAREFADKGPTGMRAPSAGKLEESVRQRERWAFLEGILWERARQEAIALARTAALLTSTMAVREQARADMLLYGECFLVLGVNGFRRLDPSKVILKL